KAVRQHPPAFCVNAVAARGHWEGIRPLEGVVDTPVLRPNGTVLDQPGYDPETGLLFEPVGSLEPIPQQPTTAQIFAARDLLLDLVIDFPFLEDTHKSTWLATVLTLVSRFAFQGPAPLFLVDSNVRGSGKGLLCDATAIVTTGR